MEAQVANYHIVNLQNEYVSIRNFKAHFEKS